MKRMWIISLLIIVAVAYYFFMTEGVTPEKLWGILAKWHKFAPIIFLLMHTFRPLTFLPTSILVFLASLYFDFWSGFLLNLTGLLMGMTLAYYLGRFLGHQWLVTKYPASKKVIDTLNTGSWPFLAAVRMVPIFPADLVSYACGVCSIPYFVYLTGSIVGSLPGLSLLMAVGTGIRGGELLNFAPLMVVVVLMAFWAWRKVKIIY